MSWLAPDERWNARWPGVWPGARAKRRPGAPSGSPDTWRMFVQVGNTAWMRRASPFLASGSRSITAGSVQNLYSTSEMMSSEFGNTGLLGVLFHQPEDVIGMTMGNENGVDLGGIDAGRLHVGHHLAGGGLHLPARAAV